MSKILHTNPGSRAASHRAVDRRAGARLGRHCGRERGVVLVITLILIVILSLLGTFAIRNATQSERSINGVRSTEVAREAAETALRFCEQIAIFDADGKDYTEYSTTGLRGRIIATTILSESDPAAAWRTESNWTSSAIAVPAAFYKNDTGGTSPLKNAPLCLIQKIDSTSTPKLTGYLITARGFGNNTKLQAGKYIQGAESWMQSVLTSAS